ncbi:hypothetical protein K435DRAFT_854646 [Dendrothele bispora CBS 962.96]|uniref:Uncharacterized protein n=1 Tax=Dendrothele bispora (strain CBS 962.96) TaxID=1314807 RepID=A0A4S8MDX9_DENBC|nr:hypothetical protein K435DRAFT_854646 [Dendrothele bispora CBS 962.96]
MPLSIKACSPHQRHHPSRFSPSLLFLRSSWEPGCTPGFLTGASGLFLINQQFFLKMRYTLSVLALALAVSARPAPTRRQQNLDLTVLKFADVLEQFESGFYSAALSKFQESDFTSAGFVSSDVPVQQFTVIQSDEATHSTVLQGGNKY